MSDFNYRTVSYNAKYWKIDDDNSLIIELLTCNFGSNEKCYYFKMDR